MLIKDLKLSFDREEGGKKIFVDGSGAELVLTDALLKDFKENEKDLYLSLSHQANSSSQDQKKLLNELLDDEVE